jgi:hypothetical protein
VCFGSAWLLSEVEIQQPSGAELHEAIHRQQTAWIAAGCALAMTEVRQSEINPKNKRFAFLKINAYFCKKFSYESSQKNSLRNTELREDSYKELYLYR